MNTPQAMSKFLVPLFSVGMVLAALFVGGCTNLRTQSEVPITGLAANKLTAASPLAIDIDNQRGSVQVEVSDKYTTPIVWAGVQSDSKAGRKPDFVGAQLVMDSGRPVLRVLSLNPKGAEARYVIIRIRVPSCAGIRVRNDGGPVRLMGVAGSIDIVNRCDGYAGGTTVIASRAINEPVTIKASHGGIDLRVPQGTSGNLNAKTGKGSLRIDVFEADAKEIKTDDHSWVGILNNGGNPIELVADDGDVALLYGRK